MARNKSELFIEADGIRPGFVRGELHELAAARTACLDRPLDEFGPQPAAARFPCNPYALDLPAPRAGARQSGNERELQTADDVMLLIHGNRQQLVFIRVDCGKGCLVAPIDGIGDDLSAVADIVVGKQPDDVDKVGSRAFRNAWIIALPQW